MLMITRVGVKFGDSEMKQEKKPLKIIKLIYSTSIGIIQIVMILRRVLVKYNFSKFTNHKVLFQN